MNGDGLDDFLIGATRYPGDLLDDAKTYNPNTGSAGEAYLIYGKTTGYKASMKLSELDDSQGFVIEGIDKGDQAGWSVNTAGDVNGDGYDDIIIGAPYAANKKGESYVIFGGDFTGDSTVTSASGDDLLTVSTTSTDADTQPRDNPLTPGDTVNTSSETRDPCFGNAVQRSPYQGDRSDLFGQYDSFDSGKDKDEQDD